MKRKPLALLALPLLILAGCSSPEPEQADKPAETETQKLTAITLSSASSRIEAGQKTDITIQTTPEGFVLKAADFNITGGAIKVQGSKAAFSAAQPGTYTIRVSKDGIDSNSLVVEVLASEEEKAAESAADSAPVQEETAYVPAETESQAPAADTTQAPAQGSETPESDAKAQESESAPVVTVADVLADPAAYENQTIIVRGSLPQTTVDDGSGSQVAVIYPSSQDTSQKLILSGKIPDFGGCDARLKGILKPDGKGGWTLDVISGFPTSNDSAGDQPNRKPGEPVSTLPKSGKFQFTSNGLRIRYGTDGLASPASGYSFNAGMSVNYTDVYQKDGYTWITYKANSGKTCSVAVGNEKTVEYGFYAGK